MPGATLPPRRPPGRARTRELRAVADVRETRTAGRRGRTGGRPRSASADGWAGVPGRRARTAWPRGRAAVGGGHPGADKRSALVDGRSGGRFSAGARPGRRPPVSLHGGRQDQAGEPDEFGVAPDHRSLDAAHCSLIQPAAAQVDEIRPDLPGPRTLRPPRTPEPRSSDRSDRVAGSRGAPPGMSRRRSASAPRVSRGRRNPTRRRRSPPGCGHGRPTCPAPRSHGS